MLRVEGMNERGDGEPEAEIAPPPASARRAAPTITDAPTADDPAAAVGPPAPPAADPHALPSSEKGSRRGRTALAIAVGVTSFLVGVAIAAKGPLTRRLVKSRAAELGIELDFDELEGGFGAVQIRNARLGLMGVQGVRVTATTLRLATRWLTVTSAEATEVGVAIEGSAGERVIELAAWSGAHADAYRVPMSATGVRLEWRARTDAAPWLVMTGGNATMDGEHATFAAPTTAFGVPLGTVGAQFTVDASGVSLDLGKTQGAEPPIHADLKTSARPPSISIALRPVELASLGTALGVTLPNRAITAAGRADLTLAAPPAGIGGTAQLELDGWMPQHPKVLDGIMHGKKTQIRGRLALAEDHASARLDDLEVRAGQLVLRGSGTLAEEGKRTMLRLELQGPLACSELARGTATNDLPGLLGELAGEVAHRVVSGSATVKVTVEADARDLAAAKVTPRVSVGCQLKMPRL
jgi:hypothetical protein